MSGQANPIVCFLAAKSKQENTLACTVFIVASEKYLYFFFPGKFYPETYYMGSRVRDNRVQWTFATAVLQGNNNPVEMDNSCIDLLHRGESVILNRNSV